MAAGEETRGDTPNGPLKYSLCICETENRLKRLKGASEGKHVIGSIVHYKVEHVYSGHPQDT